VRKWILIIVAVIALFWGVNYSLFSLGSERPGDGYGEIVSVEEKSGG
jgi:hypothetical protein